ncbi:MAG: FAD-dependent monooxygenase, partial [Pseudomonadota bacterium]|nr:FAD-dependent monooxygenase [Pseudomonadota bacterium]
LKLQDAFGYRQGKIVRVSNVASYPLALTMANRVACHRTVLVGNAAQSLHPIAGQGFNLGLRDISALIDVVTKTRSTDSSSSSFDAGSFNVTNTYAKRRKSDRSNTVTLTDTLVRTFSNHYFPTVVGRNISLLAFSAVPMAKRAFVKQTTGYADSTLGQ